MAKSNLKLTVKVHWVDRYFYIPMLKLLARIGVPIDIDKSLSDIASRIKVATE